MAGIEQNRRRLLKGWHPHPVIPCDTTASIFIRSHCPPAEHWQEWACRCLMSSARPGVAGACGPEKLTEGLFQLWGSHRLCYWTTLNCRCFGITQALEVRSRKLAGSLAVSLDLGRGRWHLHFSKCSHPYTLPPSLLFPPTTHSRSPSSPR